MAFSTYKVPLPPPVGDSAGPSFEAAAEEYVRRIRRNYELRAIRHRRYYRVSGILVILAGSSLPLLTTLDYSYKTLVVSLVGVSVSAVTALRAFYRWDLMWALLRVTEFSISAAYWTWRAAIDKHDVGDERAASARREATIQLLKDVAEIRQDEAISFFKDLPFPQGIGKVGG